MVLGFLIILERHQPKADKQSNITNDLNNWSPP